MVGKLERCGGPGWKCVGKEEGGKGKGVWEFGSLGCGKEWEWSERSGENNFFVWCVAMGTEVGREVAEWELRRRSGTEGGEGGVGLGEESGRSWGEGCVGSVPRTIFFVGVERGDGVVCVSTGRTEEETGCGCVGKNRFSFLVFIFKRLCSDSKFM